LNITCFILRQVPYHLLHIRYSDAPAHHHSHSAATLTSTDPPCTGAQLLRPLITALRSRLPPMAITATALPHSPHDKEAFEVTFRR
jgi:hypothetical protein